MTSLKWPNMFSNKSTTNVWKSTEHHEATVQNCKLLLNTEVNELFGDPYFGTTIKHFMFDQNNYILRDAVIDMIYTRIALFMPQIYVERKDINIVQDKRKGLLTCTFYGINQIDYQLDTYSIALLNTGNV